MKLTPKQEKFCNEYLIDLNATQAAIRAGYSKKTSYAIGIENLKKPIIAECVAKLRSEIQAKTAITVENTVLIIKEILDEAREAGDASNALKGADLLLKHLGGYEKNNKHEIVVVKKLDEFYEA